MNKAIYIQGPEMAGKSQIVANLFYPLEDIKITCSIDMSDNGYENKFLDAISNEKKYISLDNFSESNVTSGLEFLIKSCLENDQVVIITSREAPPDWLKEKILHLQAIR